jgi:hypothetical protein
MPKLKRPAAYDAETWKHYFTETERRKLVKLHKLQGAKFDELRDLISTKLGVKDATVIVDEAEQVIEEWADAAMDNLDKPKTPLQHLLQELYDLGEAVLDIRDEACVRSLKGSEEGFGLG